MCYSLGDMSLGKEKQLIQLQQFNENKTLKKLEAVQ